MSTEEFWKKHAPAGKMLKRISDGKYFEVISVKEVSQYTGKVNTEWILQGESGSRLPTDSHWLDCYFRNPLLEVG